MDVGKEVVTGSPNTLVILLVTTSFLKLILSLEFISEGSSVIQTEVGVPNTSRLIAPSPTVIPIGIMEMRWFETGLATGC